MRQGIPGQIIGSFEDIGKDVLKQTAQVPKDIVGKAIESIGTSTTQTQTQQQVKPVKEEKQDEKVQKATARAALEQLAGKPKQKEPSVWEKIQMEVEQKKQQQAQQAQQQAAQQLPKTQSKRSRGDLYGLKAKKGAAEMSRNVRQD